MRRFCLLWLLVLTACEIARPIQPTPTKNPPLPAEPSAVAAASAPVRALAATWTPIATLTSTPPPTATLTPIPTPTVLPTGTPTSAPVVEPVILVEHPLPNEFVPGTISVAGRVVHATGGSVVVQLRSADGQALNMEPVVATTTVAKDGVAFTAEIVIDLPPTPRLALVHVAWTADGRTRAVEVTQPINLLGRYPRVDRLVIESPRPFTRGEDATIAVRGLAPGPPGKVLARLLDDADQVLESVDARLLWHQTGLPCVFEATLSNNPAATQVQVITLGRDDVVIEAGRVRLVPRG